MWCPQGVVSSDGTNGATVAGGLEGWLIDIPSFVSNVSNRSTPGSSGGTAVWLIVGLTGGRVPATTGAPGGAPPPIISFIKSDKG